jgi:hypothetical protein
MEKKTFHALALALGATLLCTSTAQATLVVPGTYQTETGTAIDWDPPTAPPMIETPAASGKYTLNLAGLTGAVLGTSFNFKILDDQGAPPAEWGNPELTPVDSWFHTDAAGNASITVDTNTYSDGYQPATNRVTVSNDPVAVAGFYATGTWMTEAGGAADDAPGDPLFQMTAQGGGLYSVQATISEPGSYNWKATRGDFGGQWGLNGRNNNASTWAFNTFEANQQVTFLLDVSKGAISYSTIAVLAGDTDNDGVVELEEDFGPIRDNFLELTTLRSDGDLTLDGVVDVLDFHEWKTAWLAEGGSAAEIASAFASLSIPEPSSAAIALMACLGLAVRARRRCR